MNGLPLLGALGALGALVLCSLATAGYTWHANREVSALSRRVATLSAELTRAREASESAERAAQPAREGRVLAATLGATPVPEAKIREVVLGELARREDDERAQVEASLEILDDELRAALARELELDADALARVETVGDELAAKERSLLADGEAGRVTKAEAHSRYVQAWNESEQELKRALGETRHQNLVRLRQEHPEYGRSFVALRTPPLERDGEENQR